jgi:glucose-6-phosphate-specific signal transduction histidine kinase
MEASRLLERRWARAALIIAGWTLFALFLTSQTALSFNRRNVQVGFIRILLAEMAFGLFWAALTPLVLFLGRRYPIERQQWRKSLLVHFIASGLLGLATRLVRDLAFIFLASDFEGSVSLTRLLLNVYYFFDYGAMMYWLILLIVYAVDYYRRYRENELKATRLEAQLATAQLQALKMQLQPHFLFNTLHSISALVPKNPVAADKMLARLGDFLRLTLDSAGAQEVSLQQELEFLRCYLEIERIRFQDRLSVDIQIEPDALDARLPNLILQPIVENAIKHGIAPRTTAGRIEISARRLDGMLLVNVSDNGNGLPSNGNGSHFKEGVGLANTQTRLHQLYGSQYRLDLVNNPAGGLKVTLEIPFRH